MTLNDVAKQLNGKVYGNGDLVITGLAKIEEANPGDITFLSNLKYKHYLATTKASAVIIDQQLEELRIPYILVSNAYMGFVMALKVFEPKNRTLINGISEEAYIADTAKVHPDAKVAPHVYVGYNVTIGKNSILYPGVVLLGNVTVGQDCIFYPNVSVREECAIGDRVILQNGCVIGSDGFGFAPYQGRYEKIPQIGKVIIENDVEIGANSTIDRATLGTTIIKKGTKLDNLVQIAHNVVVGKHTVMAAQAGVAGSTEIGDNVTIGGQVGVSGHIKIGDQVIVAAQSGVSKSIPEKSIMFGSPALPLARQKRIDVSVRQLPDLIKRVRQLENELAEIKDNRKDN